MNVFYRIEAVGAFDSHSWVDVLRLDRLHPVVSGNKWFKLKHYLTAAGDKAVLTFGGAFSNHLLATAAATRELGLQSIGIVRGEAAGQLSHTLQQAQALGMQLFFTSREAYRKKSIPEAVFQTWPEENLCVIPEGGYGVLGMQGAKEILPALLTSDYTHLISAVGTGTTLAGITAAAIPTQQVLGVSVMKNNYSLQEAIDNLLPPHRKNQFTLLHEYHFGGYAKSTPALLSFMNRFYQHTGIPTDFVYTAKAFYACFELLRNGYLPQNARILLIHTGGLQGNASLPKGKLIFG